MVIKKVFKSISLSHKKFTLSFKINDFIVIKYLSKLISSGIKRNFKSFC